MYCTKTITDDLTWVGSNDRRLAMFEGVYSVPDGVSYNAYLLMDEKTVLFDTVDKAVSKTFLENVEHTLAGRRLDYVVVQHMEPDHSAVLSELLYRYPEATVVCNPKLETMMRQFYDLKLEGRLQIVNEGDTLETGRHTLHFVMAPMVHWPEVMMTYDSADKILFSADAFGTFGALNGAMFADEVDFMRDYLDEARRYYCNIVGKYGQQVQAVLKKASALEIEMICPLHGFVWRRNLSDFIDKYLLWSSYVPEEKAVMIAYASVYGNTENAAEILACQLRDKGVKTVMFDVSVIPESEIVAAAFRYSHLVFASTTYNAGIFVRMEAVLHDLAAHNIQNRTVALIENGSWAPTSGGLMRDIFKSCKDIRFIEQKITIKSALRQEQLAEIDALAAQLAADFPQAASPADAGAAAAAVDNSAFFKLSYGLFVLSAREGEKDNGCIINTMQQLTDSPKRVTIAVNKQNYTHDMILRTGAFNVSVLSEATPFKVFQQYGFQSGRDKNKMADGMPRTANGIVYLPDYANAVISCKVTQTLDCGTHTLFIADVTEARVLSGEPSATYQYYFDHIKPKPQPAAETKVGWVCKICGYVYEGEELPADFVCPLCKHGAEDFERIQ